MQLTPTRLARLLIGLGVSVSAALTPAVVAAPTATLVTPAQAGTRLSVDFIENRGQWPGAARFVARGAGIVALFEDQAIALQASGGQTPTLRLTFEGARAGVRPAGVDRHGRYNFYVGGDSANWRSDVPAFGRVVYRGLYDGIDLLVREEAGRLEYDLVLAPGADLDGVRVSCEGVSRLELASDGALVMHTPAGKLRQTPPRTWEVLPTGERRPLASGFRIVGPQRYGFEAPGRDARLALVVDPGLEWSTYLGGSFGDWIGPVEPARDGTGDVFVGGTTRSTDFPLFPDPTFSSLGIQDRVFVARLNASGSAVVYATFLGGWHSQLVFRGLAADAGGNAVICGQTFSPDFPTTTGAPDRIGENKDGFVVRLNPSGALIFSTFLGGGFEDLANAVAYDPAGNVIVGGTTSSSDFPTTAGSFDPTYNVPNAPADGGAHGDMFLTRLNPNGTQITYSTFIGGPQADVLEDLVVDSAGIVTVAGWVTGNNVQVFVTTPGAFDTSWNGSQDGAIARLKLDGAGAADLKYATLIGGAGGDNLWSLALDPTNPELVTFAGRSWFSDYPVTPGVVRATNPGFSELFPNNEAGIISRFRFPAAGGGSLVWSTYHHGKRITGVTVNAAGEPIVVGPEASWTLVTTQGAFDRTANGVAGVGSRGEAFIGRLNANATQYVYQSFLGGSSSEEDNFQVVPSVAWIAGNTVVVSGQTGSPDFPTTPAAIATAHGNPEGGIDGYVTKIALDADASGDLTADPPTLVQPQDGAVFRNNALVRLQWTGVIDPSGVADYEFEFSTQSAFPTSGIAFRGAVTGTEAIVPPSGVPETSLSQGTWFWRMRTADRAGNLSAWSPTRTFTISATTGQPVVSGVAVVPSSIVGGTTSPTGAVYLYDPAPAGGTVVQLSLHHNRSTALDQICTLPIPASVPATVTVPAGAYSVTFPITTTAVSQNLALSIVATAAGLGTQGAFTVSTPETLEPTSLTFVPWMLSGGTPATGTFTMSSAAPPGGTVVTLLSSHPAAASVPASVTVPAGASSATFPVTTSPVTVETDVLIQAKTAIDYWWNNLYVRPPGLPTLTGMTISPASVAGGGTSGGTLTFSGPIPLGTWPGYPDGIVQFVSSDPEVANVFPGSWYVAAGSSSSAFQIYTRGGPTARNVTLSAVFDGVTLSRALAVGAVTGVTVSSLTGNATNLSGGQGGVATVTLGAPAPTTILLTVSTSHPGLFSTLPTTLVIFAGSTSSMFGYVSNKSATAPTAVTVTAAYGASSRNLALTIGPSAETVPPVASVTLNPASVPSGGTSTGTVTLQNVAPAGGVVVQLSSGNSSIATVPPSVTVPAGATSATFTVTAQTVTTTQTVSIWGLTTLSAAGALTVTSGTPTPTLLSLALNPTTVTGGATSSGTTTLSAAAPSGGQVVSLSSSNPAVASVPASVTVAAGATSATFTVTTTAPAAQTVVTISGVSGGATRTSNLTVNPSGGGAPGFNGPTANAADSGGDGNGFESSPVNAHGDDAANAADNNSGTGTSTSCTSSQKDRHRFFNYGFSVPAGATINGVEVRLDARADSTSSLPRMCVQLSWDGGTTWTAAKQTATLGTGMASFTLGSATDTWGRTWSAGNFADASFRVRVIDVSSSTSRDFFLDWVAVRPHFTVPGPATLSAVSLSPSTVVGGSSSTGTATLTSAAPAGGAVVTLSSNNTAVATAPASVTVAAGATTATFAVATASVAANTSVTISGTYSGTSKSAVLTVTPPPPAASLSALALSPTTVTGGSPSTGTVTLTSAAPSGGAVVTLTSSNTAVATAPPSVTIAAGATSATFTVATQSVGAGTSVTMSATYAGVTRTASLTVNPQAGDTVAIQRAEYDDRDEDLRVEATSTSASATLQVFVTSTNQLIGTLTNNGGGRYSRTFSWPTNPQNITVRSSLGGSASRNVTLN